MSTEEKKNPEICVTSASALTIKISEPKKKEVNAAEKVAPEKEKMKSDEKIDEKKFFNMSEYNDKIKNVIFNIKTTSAKVYESTSSKTMKYILVISSLLVFFGVLSLVLAQSEDNQQSKYGLAFNLEESINSEKRVGIPGEGLKLGKIGSENLKQAESSLEKDEKKEVTPTVLPISEVTNSANNNNSNNNNNIIENLNGEGSQPFLPPGILIAGDEDEKNDEAGENPRIVFIERLMGLHLSAPLNGVLGGSAENDDQGSGILMSGSGMSQGENNENSIKDKVNAKWASRTRKFTIPLPNSPNADPLSQLNSQLNGIQGGQGAEGENPIVRYAAAAMMSRLLAAAARAQMETQAREAMLGGRISGKDKDDEPEEETVPVIVATMRENEGMQGANFMRPGQSPFGGAADLRAAAAAVMQSRSSNMVPPMYGRPMQRHLPHPPPEILMRPPMVPMSRSLPSILSSAGPVSPSSAAQFSQSQPTRRTNMRMLNEEKQDSQGSGQPVVVMLAIPVGSQEGKQEGNPSASPIFTSSSSHSPSFSPVSRPMMMASPFYPQPYVPYNYYQHSHPYYASHTVSSPVYAHYQPSSHYPHYHPASSGHFSPHPGHMYVAPQPTYLPTRRMSPYLPTYHHQHTHQPAASTHFLASSSPSHRPLLTRPVIEVPVEIPVPVHVPVPVSVNQQSPVSSSNAHSNPNQLLANMISSALSNSAGQQSGTNSRSDQDASSSDSDHVILFYDAELHDENSGSNSDDLESSASEESNLKFGSAYQKTPAFLSSRSAAGISPYKMKLWKEYMGAKQATSPGIRYLPVSSLGQNQPESRSDSSIYSEIEAQSAASEMSENVQPALIILAEHTAEQDQQ